MFEVVRDVLRVMLESVAFEPRITGTKAFDAVSWTMAALLRNVLDEKRVATVRLLETLALELARR